MTDGPDIEIRPDSNPSMKSDVDIRRETREMRRRQRQAGVGSPRSPWYTVLLAVTLLVTAWFVVGVLLGLQARDVTNAAVLSAINATQTRSVEATGTQAVSLSEADATATFSFVAELATGTASARATDTPTPTNTPTHTPEPTVLGGSRGEIAYISEEGGSPELVVEDLLTGERQTLTDTPATEAHPQWSPDGTRLAFSSNADGSGRHIYYIDLTVEEPEPIQLTDGISINTHPVWAPDGQSIAYRSVVGSRFFLNQIDLAGGVTTIVQLPSIDRLYEWSADGEIITFYGRTRENVFEVLAFPLDGTASQDRYALTDALGDIQSVDFTADRERVVFTATDFEPVRRTQIYLADATCPIFNADDCVIEQITDDDINYQQPRLSPDGTRIIVAANVDGNLDLFMLDLDGNIVQRITERLGDDYSPVWRPTAD